MEMLEKYKHFFTKLAFKAYCTKPLTYDLVQMHNAICQEVTVQTISTLEEMSYLEYEDRQQLIKVNTSKFKKTFFRKYKFMLHEMFQIYEEFALLNNCKINSILQIC